MGVLFYLIYSAFCFWVIFLDGAEQLEGWGAFFIFGFLASYLTPSQLSLYVGISWLALTGVLIGAFIGSWT
jgi:hypothetical protein